MAEILASAGRGAGEERDQEVARARIVGEPPVADADPLVHGRLAARAVKIVGHLNIGLDAESREAAGDLSGRGAEVPVEHDCHAVAGGIHATASPRISRSRYLPPRRPKVRRARLARE